MSIQNDLEMATIRAQAWHQMADWWLERCAELETRLVRLLGALEVGEPGAIAEAVAQAKQPITDHAIMREALDVDEAEAQRRLTMSRAAQRQ